MASSNLTAAQENLLRFHDEINTLHLVVGGERAPFGKDGIFSEGQSFIKQQ